MYLVSFFFFWSIKVYKGKKKEKKNQIDPSYLQ